MGTASAALKGDSCAPLSCSAESCADYCSDRDIVVARHKVDHLLPLDHLDNERDAPGSYSNLRGQAPVSLDAVDPKLGLPVAHVPYAVSEQYSARSTRSKKVGEAKAETPLVARRSGREPRDAEAVDPSGLRPDTSPPILATATASQVVNPNGLRPDASLPAVSAAEAVSPRLSPEEELLSKEKAAVLQAKIAEAESQLKAMEEAMKLRADSVDTEMHLPLEGVSQAPAIGFLLPDGTEKRINFGNRRPLGIRFKESNDAIVTTGVDAGGHGEALGICSGWVVQTVFGEYVLDKGAKYASEKLRSLASQPAVS